MTVELDSSGNGKIDAGFMDYASDKDINLHNVVLWGDSLSYSMSPILSALYDERSVYNRGIPGDSSTEIKDRMIAEPDKHGFVSSIWAGTNNRTAPETIKADIASMVAALGDNDHYVVIGLMGLSDDIAGTDNYNTIIQLNTDLAALYPDKFIDIRSYLIANGLSELGITPTAQDTADLANDIVPDSLRIDATHLTSDGYSVVCNQVINFIDNAYPFENSKIVSSTDLVDIFKYPGNFKRLNIIDGGRISYDSEVIMNFDLASANYFYGESAGSSTPDDISGTDTVGIGRGAFSAGPSGDGNIGIGTFAQYANTTGDSNMAFGTYTLFQNTTGSWNVAIGNKAIRNGSVVNQCIAIGHSALQDTTGNSNVGIGFQASKNNTTGYSNTCVGSESLSKNTDGARNTAVGANAGAYLSDGTTSVTSPDQSVYLGEQSRAGSATPTNEIVIGYLAAGHGSNTVTIGNDSVVATYLNGDIVTEQKTPSSATDNGIAGTICADSDYIYVCVDTNTWKRVALSTW